MSFFQYTQNNSGGRFDYDKSKGITAWVVIEADNADEADERAEEIGLYFDGCENGTDCECCGDRWHTAYGSGDESPMVYQKHPNDADLWRWIDGQQVCVHYKDGRTEWFA